MAWVAHLDEAGQVDRRFQVHSSKIRVCYWGGCPEDDRQHKVIRPGMLPDFPDSEVSKPMYVMDKPQPSQPPDRELVRPIVELPRSELQDEALRTEPRGDDFFLVLALTEIIFLLYIGFKRFVEE